jgi:radical SAM superfamily enzyme YgiQ (UPF0313 family)
LINRVDPIKALGPALQGIEKPARYLGGESGSRVKADAAFSFMLCFPDLYEIGMSNNAMRILYAGLNDLDGVSCERVFAPAKDFAALLKQRALPLYGLESGRAVACADILGFTVGYELAATTILAVLDASCIPLKAEDRSDEHPIVIAGGPAMTNPAPYAAILDAVWIGEAEESFFQLVAELAALKAGGAGREALLERLRADSAVWMPGKTAVRRVFEGFADKLYGHRFPIPVLKPVQDHGVVEVMRGCPNGCRFCHAGYFYRPQRLRSPRIIWREVETQIKDAGHRQITLSSLSSGDYPGIFTLLSLLNERWAGDGVSFQLPSLKVESFPLELIDQISGTRKSGLTFAVETPLDQWQMTINKRVGLPKVLSILREAEDKGYKVAKFYFMLGLPLPAAEQSEEEAVIGFVRELLAATKLRLNITLATFVPKPHTAFQWSAQLPHEEAARRIYAIKDALRQEKSVKISYHGPFLSWLEGIVARGDERVGELLLDAYARGASFDAWDDLFNKEAWLGALEASGLDPKVLLGEQDFDAILPWKDVKLRVSTAYLKREAMKARESIMTPICAEECGDNCASCSDALRVPDKSIHADMERDFADLRRELDASPAERPLAVNHDAPDYKRKRLLFSYEKTGVAAYYPHHTLWNIIASAFERAGVFLEYSQGFNPAPRLEISEPLSLGVESLDDYGTALLKHFKDDDFTKEQLSAVQRFLPRGLSITRAGLIQGYEAKRIPSLSMIHWGSIFRLDFSEERHLGARGVYEALHLELAKHEALRCYELYLADDACVLELTLPFGAKRELGLQTLFKLAGGGTELRDSGVRVQRHKQYAKDPEGKPVSYMAFFGMAE